MPPQRLREFFPLTLTSSSSSSFSSSSPPSSSLKSPSSANSEYSFPLPNSSNCDSSSCKKLLRLSCPIISSLVRRPSLSASASANQEVTLAFCSSRNFLSSASVMPSNESNWNNVLASAKVT